MERLSEMRQNAHGTYETVTQEKELMRITTTTKLVVVSFFHKDFRRCQIMDKHLEALAKKHFRTKFVRIDVENAPFLVERLKIQILPCVLAFVDGISVDRLVGFEELGNNDNFTMAQLEKRLASKSEVIKLTADNAQPSKRKTVLGFPESGSDSDD
ncbi:thioredoxin-like protein [Hyaloraphidium curvatum]|nr:thioredoxin-like protein [Hyaloraphidium curvatum]